MESLELWATISILFSLSFLNVAISIIRIMHTSTCVCPKVIQMVHKWCSTNVILYSNANNLIFFTKFNHQMFCSVNIVSIHVTVSEPSHFNDFWSHNPCGSSEVSWQFVELFYPKPYQCSSEAKVHAIISSDWTEWLNQYQTYMHKTNKTTKRMSKDIP